MKVLLINPPFIEAYGQYAAAAKVGAQPQMPLGLMYIAAVLEKLGHEVHLIDADVEEMSVNNLLDVVRQEKPDVMGLSATTPIYNSAVMLFESVKKINPEIITIFGGNHITALPQRTMEECPEIDYGVLGEGEVVIERLMNALVAKEPVDEIKSLTFRRDGEIIVNEGRTPVEDVDTLPLPARHLMKYEKYLWSVPHKGIVPVTSIISQRGCPFQCIFCSANFMFPGKTRYRDIIKVIDEMEEVVKKFNIDHFMICDDTLTLNVEKVSRMCKEIKRRNLKISFEGYTRANTITEALLLELKEAGLVRLSFGIETGNPKILKAIKKGVELEDLKTAYKLCKKVGIEARGSLMIGHPFETKETVQQSLDFVKTLDCDQMYVNVTTPYPGSELYDLAKEGFGGLRLLTEDWKEYRRYGNAVMEMNDLSAEELVQLQKSLYKRFYLRPRIIWYNLKRAGFKAAFVNSWAFFKSVIR